MTPKHTVKEARLRHTLIKSKKKMSSQDYHTLWGQINHGDIDGADKGLRKILCRNMKEARYV